MGDFVRLMIESQAATGGGRLTARSGETYPPARAIAVAGGPEPPGGPFVTSP